MTRDLRCLPVLFLSLLCGVAPMVSASDSVDRAALEAVAQSWARAFNARDADALTALTTDDVILMDPEAPPVSGRKAARAAWEQAFAAANGRVTTTTKEIDMVGDVAWRVGAITYKLSSGEVGRGQSLEVWKRVQGQWRIHRQMSSSILARPIRLPRRPPADPVLDKPTN